MKRRLQKKLKIIKAGARKCQGAYLINFGDEAAGVRSDFS
jgi:hypothetical protein